MVNDGVEEGEEIHCNQVCCRGRGGGLQRALESSGGGTKEIDAYPAITGPTYMC